MPRRGRIVGSEHPHQLVNHLARLRRHLVQSKIIDLHGRRHAAYVFVPRQGLGHGGERRHVAGEVGATDWRSNNISGDGFGLLLVTAGCLLASSHHWRLG